MLVGTFTLAATLGFASSPNPETIQATYAEAGNTDQRNADRLQLLHSSDLQTLSLAFQEGQDRGLATALSKTKAGRAMLDCRGSQL